jgi:uncharacterized protein (TIGR03086 family)
VTEPFEGLPQRYALASAEFETVLRLTAEDQWELPTPCAEWDVRLLVNHMVRGNLNYAALVRGGTAERFLRLRDRDALGTDPLTAYRGSVRECAAAFTEPGALDRSVDHPLGRIGARQALAVRVTDVAVHTWDLARAVGADDRLDASLVAWITAHLPSIYASLSGLERFFAAPGVKVSGLQGSRGVTPQDRLLHRLGRSLAEPPATSLDT